MAEICERWNWTAESRLFALTGAGISAESGVPTFRDSGGLWEGFKVEEVATPQAFAKNPELVIDFYNKRRLHLNKVQPNPAHLALARLENLLEDRLTLVTQNVDDLHERGGSKNLIHMHGELRKLRCLRNPDHIVETKEEQTKHTRCPQCASEMRPHIVWFGEEPLLMEDIYAKLGRCTHFLYIGTSSQVYPAAGFKRVAKQIGAKVLCINLEACYDPYTEFVQIGQASQLVPRFVDWMEEECCILG